ncbi:hypothetical protein [Orgyia leucostigma nucleopolyhedrovirus]|uniref:Uncharacterized protein n=1 Tax=Orgyia leucostigma nucleopolyhedrovirus TaxID=490711 RepID=B0FDY5_9ABAC|nr:hypothetical protein [Orgyia leucostigma nucleopolyhedrovirus]ABY65843.1 hypothetical protein [Orgyia leucostigma nucleopolyhedrovirus]
MLSLVKLYILLSLIIKMNNTNVSFTSSSPSKFHCGTNTGDKLEASYLDYYKAAQSIIKFVKGFIKNKEQYSYADYKRFAETTVKLVGDLIDDYMAGGFDLWSTSELTTKTTNQLNIISNKIRDDLRDTDEKVQLQSNLDVYNDLIQTLEFTLEQRRVDDKQQL